MAIDLSKKAQLGKYIREDGKSKHKIMREVMADCHKYWSQIVRSLDGHTCQWCGSKNKPQAHHIVAQGICSIIARYIIENGMTLCYACHIHRLKIDPDGYIEFRDNWLKERGLNYQEMKTIYCARSRITTDGLKILCAALERKAKECGTQKR